MIEANVKARLERTALLQDSLAKERVCMLDATTKAAALREMIDLLSTCPNIQDQPDLTRAVFEREDLMSTGIGCGLAVPHVRLSSVSKMTMAVGISREGIADYASLDDSPVHLIFLIAAREGNHTEYLRLLAAISSRAKDLKGRLVACEDTETFCQVFMTPDGEQ